MNAQTMLRCALIAGVFSLPACNGIDLGDNPSREVAKESGPLTLPPAAVRNGTAR